jgi:hypothetical protein
MLKILNSCKTWPTSRPKIEGENSNINKSIQTKFWVSYLERKIIENLHWDINEKRKTNLLL